MIDNCGRNINYMRVSVTELCNLRCRYCMPREGIEKRPHHLFMTIEELLDAVKCAASLGVTKIRITGGEPLVRRGLLHLCSGIANIPEIKELCMTTNGTLLPQLAKDLKAAGVNRLNISLDTLRPARYKYITRLGDLKDVLQGIDAAFEAGFENTKINNVLMGGFNDDEIRDFAKLAEERPLDVRFIELMPIGGGLDFKKSEFISCEHVLQTLPELEPLELTDGVASMYKLPGAKGRIGLIRPISCEFCDSCNKLRLTADGMLKPCLHSHAEVNIKGMNPHEMHEAMKQAILSKPARRQALDAENPSQAGRDMNRIGG